MPIRPQPTTEPTDRQQFASELLDPKSPAKPIIRSALAFIIYLRYGQTLQPLQEYYNVADRFIDELEADLNK
jgi:hypothetical protein